MPRSNELVLLTYRSKHVDGHGCASKECQLERPTGPDCTGYGAGRNDVKSAIEQVSTFSCRDLSKDKKSDDMNCQYATNAKGWQKAVHDRDSRIRQEFEIEHIECSNGLFSDALLDAMIGDKLGVRLAICVVEIRRSIDEHAAESRYKQLFQDFGSPDGHISQW